MRVFPVALFAVFSFEISLANIINVPGDQPTIQSGIDAATGYGDTVLVAPGEYTELFSFQGKAIVVKSSDGPMDTKIIGSGNVTASIVNGEGADATLEGFTFEGGGTAIQVNNGATIRNNILTHQTNSSWAALIVQGPAKIINNTICHGANGGIASYSSAAVIKNNIIVNNNAYGIYGPATITYNDVFGNHHDYTYGATAGPGCISVNPEFMNEAERDYRLKGISPCIDSGDPDIIYNDSNGSRNDMGAVNFPYVLPYPENINLGTEDGHNVVNHSPLFYWTFSDHAYSPYAYEIEVGTDLDWTYAEKWATGQVISPNEYALYEGATLEDGVDYYVRIRLNNGVVWGSWLEYEFHMNTLPPVPTTIDPINQKIVTGNAILTIEINPDVDNEEFDCEFELYEDGNLQNLRQREVLGFLESGEVNSPVFRNIDGNTEYWWRARVHDGFEYSDWSETQSFITWKRDTIHVPENQPSIQAGIDAADDADIVLVAPGTYYDNLDFKGKNLALLSSGGADVTFVKPLDEYKPIIFFINKENINAIVSGFTFEGGKVNNFVLIHSYSDPEICYNKFTAYAGTGVVIHVLSNAYIHHNLFYNNAGICCITITQGGTAQIVNNTFCNNMAGINTENGNGIAKNNIITGCYNITGDIFSYNFGIRGPFESLEYNNVWDNIINYLHGAAPGPTSISADPLYVNVPENDFRLQVTSPCIDAGHPHEMYKDPDQTRNDMGAFAFGSTALPLAADSYLLGETRWRVINHEPVFAWTFYDEFHTHVQEAYEIQVGNDTNWDNAELWASGQVISSERSAKYEGLPLQDGERYYYRIRLLNRDKWGAWQGNYFVMNVRSEIPQPEFPINGFAHHYESVHLVTQNSESIDGDSTTYDFEVYSDSWASELVYAEYDISEQDSITSSELVTGLEAKRDYWWRVRSFDGYEYSEWSPMEYFYARGPGQILVPEEISQIQFAIDISSTGDTIKVDSGTYQCNINYLGKAIHLLSDSGPLKTTLTAKELDTPVILFANGEDTTSVIDGFTITGTEVNSGIFCEGSSPIIRNCIIRNCNNNHDHGGGIICRDAGAKIRNNKIFNNSCMADRLGGGIFARGNTSDTLEIIANEIYSNVAGKGGGIGCFALSFYTIISENVIYDNRVYSIGSGGGIHFDSHNCEIEGNTICYNYGGINAPQGVNVDIRNNIIAYNYYYGLESAEAIYDYNDFWLNSGSNSMGPNGISSDPKFVNNSNRIFNLKADSPCIDAGDPAPTYRDPDGTRCDMGALYYVRNYICGDANGDASVNLADAAFLINFFFNFGQAPEPYVSGDTNSDGVVNMADPAFIINYIFFSGPAPCEK